MERCMEYILNIYKTKSFSKSANELFISQPALSAIVKKEETRQGITIFNRKVKPIALTAAGEKYIAAARKIQKIEAELKRQLHQFSNSVSVGSSAFFCANILPDLTSSFHSRYPDCHVACKEGNAKELVSMLHKGDIDCVISVDKNYGRNITEHYLLTEQIVLCVPRGFLQDKELIQAAIPETALIDDTFISPAYPAVSLAAFSNLPFILLTKGNDLYQRAKKMMAKAALHPSSIQYMDQLQSSFLAAKIGRGIVFVRSDLVKFMENNPELLFYKLDDPLAVRDVKIFCKTESLTNQYIQEFTLFCIEYCKHKK